MHAFFYLISEGGAEAWELTGIDLALVELLGAGYVVDYCVSRYKHKQEEKQFRAYLTDVLMYMNNSIANRFGGMVISKRYIDLNKPEDNRSGDEIAVDVMQRAGLTFANKES